MANKTNLKKLIAKNARRLQKLKEQKASLGLETQPHILTEIEDIEAEIEKLQAALKLLGERTIDKNTSDTERRLVIYLQGDLSSLTTAQRQAKLNCLAELMKISRQAIVVYSVHEGSLAFDLGVPPRGIQRLRLLLHINSKRLYFLKVKKVILPTEMGAIEEWIVQKGRFDLITSLRCQ